MTQHEELLRNLKDISASDLHIDDLYAAIDALEAQSSEIADRERLFWEACKPHGKVGEVVYLTYKTKRDAAIAAKGGE